MISFQVRSISFASNNKETDFNKAASIPVDSITVRGAGGVERCVGFMKEAAFRNHVNIRVEDTTLGGLNCLVTPANRISYVQKSFRSLARKAEADAKELPRGFTVNVSNDSPFKKAEEATTWKTKTVNMGGELYQNDILLTPSNDPVPELSNTVEPSNTEPEEGAMRFIPENSPHDARWVTDHATGAINVTIGTDPQDIQTKRHTVRASDKKAGKYRRLYGSQKET